MSDPFRSLDRRRALLALADRLAAELAAARDPFARETGLPYAGCWEPDADPADLRRRFMTAGRAIAEAGFAQWTANHAPLAAGEAVGHKVLMRVLAGAAAGDAAAVDALLGRLFADHRAVIRAVRSEFRFWWDQAQHYWVVRNADDYPRRVREELGRLGISPGSAKQALELRRPDYSDPAAEVFGNALAVLLDGRITFVVGPFRNLDEMFPPAPQPSAVGEPPANPAAPAEPSPSPPAPPAPPRPDGPFEPNGFAYGERESRTEHATAWKLIKAMWGRSWRQRGAVFQEVWGSTADDRPDGTMHTTASRANDLLKKVGYPRLITYAASPTPGFDWKAAAGG